MKKHILLTLLPISLLLAGCTNSGPAYKVKIDRAQTTSYQDVQPFDSNNIVLRAPVIADEHTSRTNPVDSSKIFLENCDNLRVLTDNKDCDLLISAGDHTLEGTLLEDEIYMNCLEAAFPGSSTYLFSCYGNHDVEWGRCASRLEHAQYFNTLGMFENDENDSTPELGNRHKVVNGFHFLTIDIAKYGTMAKNYLNDGTKSWAKNILNKCLTNEPNKPVFVIGHAPAINTVYGSLTSQYMGGIWGGSQDVYDLLKDYPNVIYLSGHTHYGAQDERNIWQKEFTAINVPTISGGLGWDQYYCGLEEGSEETFDVFIHGLDAHNMYDTGEALYLEIDKNNNTRITRYYLGNHTPGQIKNAWVVPAPKADKSHLTKYVHSEMSTFNESPYVADDFEFTLFHSIHGEVYVQFDTFLDDDMIYAYDIQIFDSSVPSPGDMAIPKDRYMFIDEWRWDRWQRNIKGCYTHKLDGIFPISEQWTIRVMAIDSWGDYCIKYPTNIITIA